MVLQNLTPFALEPHSHYMVLEPRTSLPLHGALEPHPHYMVLEPRTSPPLHGDLEPHPHYLVLWKLETSLACPHSCSKPLGLSAVCIQELEENS